MPLVSIVIPCYNPGPFLRESIQSVIDQTVTDWELILVDDGSPEDLSYAASLHPSITLLRQRNQGQAVARNVGIAHASGRYVALLDQDDLWRPTFLEKQLAVLEASPEVALSHAQFEIIDEHGAFREAGFGRHQTYHEMLQGSGICGCSGLVIRREMCQAVGLFEPLSQPAEDYDFYLRVGRQYMTAFVPSVEVAYRKHASNQTKAYRKGYEGARLILHKHGVYAGMTGDLDAVRAAREGQGRYARVIGAQAYDAARKSLGQRRLIEFARHFWFAYRHSPRYVTQSLCSYPIAILKGGRRRKRFDRLPGAETR